MERLIEMLLAAIKNPIATGIVTTYNDMSVTFSTVSWLAADDIAVAPNIWNVGAYNIAEYLSKNFIAPVAIIILTYVLCYELITMVINSNNFQQIDTSIIIRWVFKMAIAIFVVEHTFDILNWIFTITADITEKALVYINHGAIDSLSLGFNHPNNLVLSEIELAENSSLLELLCLSFGVFVGKIFLWVLVPILSLVAVCRMMNIYIYMTLAPIPFATLGNREWGNSIGNSFLRGLFVLGFQAFIIVASIGIYMGVAQSIFQPAQDIQNAIIQLIILSIVLVFVVAKSGHTAKAIFSAH